MGDAESTLENEVEKECSITGLKYCDDCMYYHKRSARCLYEPAPKEALDADDHV